MTDAELDAAIEDKRLNAQIEAKRAKDTQAAATPEQAPPVGGAHPSNTGFAKYKESRKGKYEGGPMDQVDALVGQGLMFNYGDEVMSAVESVSPFHDATYDEAWKRRKGERARYEKDNQAEALALQIGGSLLTGGWGGAKLLGAKALKNAGPATKILAAMSAGGFEGGVAGVGAADQGDRVSGGLKNSLRGAVSAGVLSGVGAGVNALVKRSPNIPDLARGGNIENLSLPLAVPETNKLGRFYRNWVPKAFGTDYLHEQAGRAIRKGGQDINAAKRLSKTIKAKGAQATKSAQARVQLKADADKAAQDVNFRREVLAEAMPASMSPQEKTDILALATPQKQADAMARYMKDEAFQSVKSRSFKVSKKEMEDAFAGLFDDDAALEAAAEGYMPKLMAKFAKKFDDGHISGDDLMELRNSYSGRGKSFAPDNTQAAHSVVKKRFDKMIREKMSGDPAALAEYEDDLARYGAYKTWKKAVAKASNEETGEFTAKQFIQAIPDFQKGRGTGPLQARASRLHAAQKAAKKAVAAAKENVPEKLQAARADNMSTGRLDRAMAAQETLKARAPKTGASTSRIISKALTAVGAPVGYAVASPTGQRLAAKQTAGQKMLDVPIEKLLRSKLMGTSLSDVLRFGPSSVWPTIASEQE